MDIRVAITRGQGRRQTGSQAPHQLPRDIAEFVGRAEELRRLDAIAVTGGDSAPVICVLEGMAGVGKTRLAVHAAHRIVSHYADIQLFADLRGFDPARPPADPGTVLGTFLRLLEVGGPRIPDGLEARAALYRDRLDGRRALIVLDDAATEE